MLRKSLTRLTEQVPACIHGILKVNAHRADILVHWVDGDGEGGVIPLHLGPLVRGHDLWPVVGSLDADHPEHDHEEQEADAHHHDDGHTHPWKQATHFGSPLETTLPPSTHLQTIETK